MCGRWGGWANGGSSGAVLLGERQIVGRLWLLGRPTIGGLAEGVEEGSDVVGEEGWLFQGCEVAAVVDVGPAGDGVRRFAVAADCYVVGECQDGCGYAGVRSRGPRAGLGVADVRR